MKQNEMLYKDSLYPDSIASIYTEVWRLDFKNRANFCEISMARLALIPVPDQKNNVRFVIYAKNYPYGKFLGQSGKIFSDRYKLNKRLLKKDMLLVRVGQISQKIQILIDRIMNCRYINLIFPSNFLL